jgi:nucleoside-diphosphate-sugar epimerase
MRILLTGSSGQLGTEIARQLANKHEPIGIDMTPGASTQHVIDIRDRRALSAVMTDIEAIIHIASFHQPQLATHSRQDFIDVNITGTLNLLEASVQHHIQRFVYTSTTSLYGYAMEPTNRATWVTEELSPRPRDMYDITKQTAEELCRHFALRTSLPMIILRTSRFFEQSSELSAIYRLSRGVDVRDAASAHLLAITNRDIRFDLFNISARSPFQKNDTLALWQDAPSVLRRYFPNIEAMFTQRHWQLPARIDRIYVIAKAEQRLGYRPLYNFEELLSQSSAI